MTIRHPVDAAAPSYRWWVLLVTSIGALMASLTSGTLIIALPEILRDLHTDIFSLLWIVVGYTLVATVLVLNAGRLADMVGRARSYTLGFVDLHGRLDPVRARSRRDPADPVAAGPGCGRGASDGQRHGPGHGRVSAARARPRPRHQRHGHRRRRDHGSDPGRLADRLRLAHRLLVQRADRACRSRRRRAHPRRAVRPRAARRDRLVRLAALLRRADGRDDRPRLRRPVRLDDMVGPRRVPGLHRRRAGLPVGRGPSPRSVARPDALPGPTLRHGQPDRLPQRDRPQRRAVPAGVLPPGGPRRGSGHGRDHARAAGDRAGRAVADQRHPGRSIRLAGPGHGRHGDHRARPGRTDDASIRRRPTGSWPSGSWSSAPDRASSTRPIRAP